LPLRPVALFLAALLAFQLAVALLPSAGAQQTPPPSGSPISVGVSEYTPWFDSQGVNLSYTVEGSYPYLTGFTHYSGMASVRVMGLYPNGSLRLNFESTVSSPLAPNGSVADDPFFPGYLPVLPSYMVAPRSFSVISPGYAIFFTYKGTTPFEFDGSSISAYVYLVTASQGVGGASAIRKFYYVSSLNGLILYENLSNPYTNSTFTMRLKAFSEPADPARYPLRFEAPVYAQPGAQLNYTATGQPPETMSYTTLFSEGDGEFMFEKVNYVTGSPQTPAFFLDNYTQPLFYPAVHGFQQVVKLGVSLSFDAPLVYVAKTTVNTPAGTFPAYVYTNKSLGFEAYFDTQTGVAVFLEVPPPGGYIELSYSNIVRPPPPSGTTYLAIGVAGAVAALTLLVLTVRGRIRRGQSAYIRSRRR